MEWSPRNRKLFVFSVPERNKIAGSSLYQPQANRGSLTRCEDIWVLTAASDCTLPWKRGEHCFISDGFEADPTHLDLWDEYKDLPEFQELRDFVASVDGKVTCQVVHENSIMAKVEEAETIV
jgi:hypothetical protein